MKSSTLFGILIGFLAIFGAFIWEGGTIDALFMLPAMTIVFGGTLAAGLAGSSFQTMAKLPILFKIAFFPKKYDAEKIIDKIADISAIARKNGILAIEAEIASIEHPFLKKLFQTCVDGVDPENLQKIAEAEMGYIADRHDVNIGLMIKLGGYSPTMGIIGTVMGLISTLAAAGSDPNVLIHHIASAFIATMWGIFMANIVWLPVGDKLKRIHDEEMQLCQVMLDGVSSVQLGEVPSVIRTRLVSFFPLPEQEKIIKKQVNKFPESLANPAAE